MCRWHSPGPHRCPPSQHKFMPPAMAHVHGGDCCIRPSLPGAGVADIQVVPPRLQRELGTAQLPVERVGGARVLPLLGLRQPRGRARGQPGWDGKEESRPARVPRLAAGSPRHARDLAAHRPPPRRGPQAPGPSPQARPQATNNASRLRRGRGAPTHLRRQLRHQRLPGGAPPKLGGLHQHALQAGRQAGRQAGERQEASAGAHTPVRPTQARSGARGAGPSAAVSNAMRTPAG